MSLGRKIRKIESIDAEKHQLVVVYDGGEVRRVSLAHVFTNPKGLALEVLRGALFDSCFVEAGALAWPNGLELCPDSLWEHSQPAEADAA